MTHRLRTDLGGVAPDAVGDTLLGLVHISDLHVLDAGSPARAEWVELEGAYQSWRPLLHMHRPYDALTAFAVHAHIETIADDPLAPLSRRPYELVVSTGDNIDNAQRNELDAYLALMAGGVARLSAAGSAQDASADTFAGSWPYWSPDGSVADEWRRLGYPVVDDFIARASAAIRCNGLRIPWTSVPGNHDLLRQGTALTNPALERIAVGATKSLRRPRGFAPADPLTAYLDAPESFATGRGFTITADADRRAIERREWIEAHVARGALGYTSSNVEQGVIDSVIDTEHVRFVLLDTNHPDGDYQGSIGVGQLAWLDEQLAEVDRQPDRVAMLVSHHGADSLINERCHRADRLLADGMLAVVHRHRSVVAWLVGHRHLNSIVARPGAAGGFWEITTASIIDWPSQARAIELVRHRNGTLELACTLLDHHDAADGLATLHRDLAHRFTSTGVATRMAGSELDGNVRLVLPRR